MSGAVNEGVLDFVELVLEMVGTVDREGTEPEIEGDSALCFMNKKSITQITVFFRAVNITFNLPPKEGTPVTFFSYTKDPIGIQNVLKILVAF